MRPPILPHPGQGWTTWCHLGGGGACLAQAIFLPNICPPYPTHTQPSSPLILCSVGGGGSLSCARVRSLRLAAAPLPTPFHTAAAHDLKITSASGGPSVFCMFADQLPSLPRLTYASTSRRRVSPPPPLIRLGGGVDLPILHWVGARARCSPPPCPWLSRQTCVCVCVWVCVCMCVRVCVWGGGGGCAGGV